MHNKEARKQHLGSIRRKPSSVARHTSFTPYIVGFIILLIVFFLVWKSGQISLSQCLEQQCAGNVVLEHTYTVTRHTDVNGEDLMHVQARDLDVVKRVCDLFEECAGFNSNGWLKTKVSMHVPGPADLYIKGAARESARHATIDVSYPSSSVSNDYAHMMKTMKIYIYETSVGLKHHTLRSGGYGVERMLMEQLAKSPFRTRKPEEAHFFFIPLRCSAYILGFPLEEDGIRAAKQYAGEMLAQIQSSYPYWDRANGADHFYVCAHDIGAGVGGDLLKNSIALVNTADYEDPYFTPNKDISLPPNPLHGANSLPDAGRGGANIDPKSRTILAFFAGDVTSGRIRPTLWRHFVNDPDFTIVDREVAWSVYLNYLKQSKFCLVPRGREVWSPRLMDAIFYGCVPVILSDHYHLPLQGLVDWTKFSVIVSESQIYQLKAQLRAISDTSLAAMQKQLTEVYRRFVWNNPSKPYDAFYSVMYQLWQRRNVVRYCKR